MNPTRQAIGLGLRRGWTEFSLSLRSAQDQGFYLFMGAATLGYLWANRNSEVEGTGLMLPTVALPSILGGLLAFGVIIGPGYALAMEREDGTLLRHKALPHGMQGYVTGQLLYHSLGLAPLLLVILVPGFLLFDGLMSEGASGWLTFAWVLVLGLAATLPIGMILGSVVPSVQKVGTWACSRSSPSPRSRGSSRRCRRSGGGCRSWARSSPPTGSAWACGRPSCRTPRRLPSWAARGGPGRRSPSWSPGRSPACS